MERALVAGLVVQLTLGNDPGLLPVLQGLFVMCWVLLARRRHRSVASWIMQARWGGRS